MSYDNSFMIGFLAGLLSAHWNSIGSGTFTLINLWCKRRPIQIKKISTAPRAVWNDDTNSESSSQDHFYSQETNEQNVE